MIYSYLCLWVQYHHRLLCILRQPESSACLPNGITSCFTFLTLLVVVVLGHVYSALDSFFFLAAVLIVPHKLISFEFSLVLSVVFEATFGEAI